MNKRGRSANDLILAREKIETMSDDKMILAYRAPTSMDAALLVQALEAVGITTVQSGGQASSGFGELPADSLQVDIWIAPDKAELARKTIEDIQRQDKAQLPEWACAKCGESNDGEFEICWSCQAPHDAA